MYILYVSFTNRTIHISLKKALPISQMSASVPRIRWCSKPFASVKRWLSAEETSVLEVYNTGGTLLPKLLGALHTQGLSTTSLSPASLSAVDQFHIGGLKATKLLCTQLPLHTGSKVLDIGCGIGGFSRHVAFAYPGCSVHGIDLSPDYIEVCKALKSMTGVRNTTYEVCSVNALLGADEQFDIACMLHVGMNIADKKELFQQVFRVLRSGGTFAIYDVMRSPGAPESALSQHYPLPWANEAKQSFIEDAGAYISAAESFGFEIVAHKPMKDFAVNFFEPMVQRFKENKKMPAFSLALLFGEQHADTKLKNLIELIQSDVVVPTELILRKKE